MGTLATTLAGERMLLLAQRALYWPRERTLFVADVHLGKAAAFRAGGVPVPRGATASDLSRLTALLAGTGARRLVASGGSSRPSRFARCLIYVAPRHVADVQHPSTVRRLVPCE